MSDMAERFARDTVNHRATVLHDDGLYRHVRLSQPGSGTYWFELVTWPGALAINGDMGQYTFRRLSDMFAFFRGDTPKPCYWAEKVGQETHTCKFSESRFRRVVRDHAADYETELPGLADAVEAWLTTFEPYDESIARAELDEFSFTPTNTADHPLGWKPRPWQFSDTWEWDFRDWTAQFEWCCHAIPWGIARYDELKRAAA